MMNRVIPLAVIGVGAVACGGNGSVDAEATNGASPGDLAMLSGLEARVAQLETALQPETDYRGILDNELQYTRGLDRHDEEMISTVFWPDARVSYGELVSMDEMAAWANAGHAENAAHQHHVTGLTLDIDGNTAHEEGYIFFSSDMARDSSFDTVGEPTPGRAAAGTLTTFGTGRYVNRYERRDGEWRIIVHEYVHDISLMLEPVDLCATACLGRWDREDISYMRPLRALSVEERERRARESRQPKAAAPANASEHEEETR
jgi:hypothetical protein